MMKPRSALILLLTTALTGCAFLGGRTGYPPPLRHPSEAGTLLIYRGGSWVGIFGTMHVAINGKPLYDLGINQSYSLRIDPGEYILTYSIGLNDCSGVVIIEPKQTHRVRLAADCMMYRN